jgi:hypothetical protein
MTSYLEWGTVADQPKSSHEEHEWHEWDLGKRGDCAFAPLAVAAQPCGEDLETLETRQRFGQGKPGTFPVFWSHSEPL